MTGCKFDNDCHVNPPLFPPYVLHAPARQVQSGTWPVKGLPLRGPSLCVPVCAHISWTREKGANCCWWRLVGGVK